MNPNLSQFIEMVVLIQCNGGLKWITHDNNGIFVRELEWDVIMETLFVGVNKHVTQS